MALDPLLLEVLACPEDKGPLLYFEDEDRLYNPRLHRSYAVRDGIPVMLVDEATAVDDAEHERLMAKAKETAVRSTLSGGQGHDRSARAEGVLDTLGMFEVTAGLPEQVAAAVGAAHGLDGLPEREYVENVVVLGMGGSGLAGDVMVAVAGPFVPVPITVVKSYDLPDFVGRGSLVFAISFSGNTEETVEAAGEAANAGASLVAVTAGGELGRLAEEWGAPVVPVPTTIPQPRAGLGAMAIPPLVVLEDIGLFPGAATWVALAVDQLKYRRDRLVQPGQHRRGGGPPHRPDHPAHPRCSGRRGRRGDPVEGPGQRERQGTGLRGGLPRALPQRDRRLGPARGRHPPGHHPDQPAPRRRASPAGPALRLRLGCASGGRS